MDCEEVRLCYFYGILCPHCPCIVIMCLAYLLLLSPCPSLFPSISLPTFLPLYLFFYIELSQSLSIYLYAFILLSNYPP